MLLSIWGMNRHLSVWAVSTHYIISHRNVPEYRERVFEILCAHIRETTTQVAYKSRIIEPIGEEPTIEIQSILNLLFVKTPRREYL